MSDYNCDECNKEYQTRAGLWKHKKAKHTESTQHTPEPPTEQETESPPVEPPIMSEKVHPSPIPTEEAHTESVETGGGNPDWMSHQFTSETHSDSIPTTFKAVIKDADKDFTKMTKVEKSALMKKNAAILKMGLTTVDHLLSKYAQAVTLDQDMIISHSESDKDLVASAQMAYLEEKGLFLTNYLSTGVIAGSLTAWYVAIPVMRIRKKAKRKLFKGKGLLGRLPLIGRFFRKKQNQTLDYQGELVVLDE